MLTFGLFFIFSVLSEAHGGTEVMTSANGAVELPNNITGVVNGVQEEVEALRREMRTMTMLVNMVNQKSDSNAKNIEKNAQEVKTKIQMNANNVQRNNKNIQSNTNHIQTVSRKAESNSNGIHSVSKTVTTLSAEVKSVEGEVQEVKKTVRSEHYCELLPSNVCGKCRCKDDSNIENKYYCDCQQLEAKRDCKEFMDKVMCSFEMPFLRSSRIPEFFLQLSNMRLIKITSHTLSDKISADKTAENLTCCRKFSPTKSFVRRKFCPPKYFVH